MIRPKALLRKVQLLGWIVVTVLFGCALILVLSSWGVHPLILLCCGIALCSFGFRTLKQRIVDQRICICTCVLGAFVALRSLLGWGGILVVDMNPSFLYRSINHPLGSVIYALVFSPESQYHERLTFYLASQVSTGQLELDPFTGKPLKLDSVNGNYYSLGPSLVETTVPYDPTNGILSHGIILVE